MRHAPSLFAPQPSWGQQGTHSFLLPLLSVTRLGTTHFMAPELILHEPDKPDGPLRDKVPRPVRHEYGCQVDIWVVGAITYETLLHRWVECADVMLTHASTGQRMEHGVTRCDGWRTQLRWAEHGMALAGSCNAYTSVCRPSKPLQASVRWPQGARRDP